ncbi:MAG: 4Fe-4S dicluster domain-containing protein, partial [Clostridiales bacterium]|nr:4Fe-4S dicluster domain-containing protein [Clostridiales bacterium]
MVNITINGKALAVKHGTTIMEAATQMGIPIPHLCYLKDINEIGACRMCMVEVEGTDRLVTSCNTGVVEGMVIHTNTPKVREARKTNLRLILSQHNSTCTTCIRSGNCELQRLAHDLNIHYQPYPVKPERSHLEMDVPVIREASKCIKCMRCIQVCDKIQGMHVWDVVGTGSRTTVDVAVGRYLKDSDCTFCGQCVTHCPTGALRERDDTAKAYSVLGAPGKVTIVQIAPAVRAAWGEAFGMPTGKATVGQLVAALRSLGADYVFDTTFSADLTIMEEGTELLQRLKAGDLKDKPMFTSCCPGWVRFLKSQYPEMTGRLSTAKSPQQMFGAVAKSWLAKRLGVEPENVYSISIMPCIAKKAERELPGMQSAGAGSDVDLVLTTRELARMVRAEHIDVEQL